mmetsp:Transcript_54430/g.151622  ORF Transcript_54430/g.151622 Transcript_54430/m.151622 type:complete len:173 (-) Transcript_54430:58-576(-)|eukprot:CAMPEP_0117530052 /NCGR_PEP_ID=MMETSP0784-20121206/38144_1 /TAXON_ID=39447 /ORGANISM="" /LENGTH=172 /DNA_ID=CAMNT_0005326383 /DNA_START=132 /DNA_END=650 /DNA_ORIENTATION=+
MPAFAGATILDAHDIQEFSVPTRLASTRLHHIAFFDAAAISVPTASCRARSLSRGGGGGAEQWQRFLVPQTAGFGALSIPEEPETLVRPHSSALHREPPIIPLSIREMVEETEEDSAEFFPVDLIRTVAGKVLAGIGVLAFCGLALSARLHAKHRLRQTGAVTQEQPRREED